MIGKTISHYKILEKLGSGGMGVVYKAQDLKLDRFVALKFLPPHISADGDEKKRFIHEAKAASALQHNNICTIHEIGETDDGQMFICMDYYEGETLKKKIERGPLNLEDAIDIAIQISQGLAKAHSKEITHRDIKPANILITEEKQVKIVDFGLAKLAGRTVLTKEGTTIGTVAYMSPEQAQGTEVDHRTDIWALGVVLYEMLTGKQPFAGDYEQAVMYSIMNEDAEPITGLRTGVPMELERIVNKCLEKTPGNRYQSVNELIVDLRRIRKVANPENVAPAAYKKLETASFKKRAFIWIGVSLAVIFTAIAGYLFLAREASSPERIPIAVVDVINETGEKELDGFIRSAHYIIRAIAAIVCSHSIKTI
ncbi:serine/threonine protein kinase [candidate division KSB1 bacterium]|nr:serine/threonine protein kinase [candidate division KSB1 bacterium]